MPIFYRLFNQRNTGLRLLTGIAAYEKKFNERALEGDLCECQKRQKIKSFKCKII